ncbi:MAG: trypsin-like peptidase domain-containing protein [Syntrophorhabdaceae bacterium]
MERAIRDRKIFVLILSLVLMVVVAGILVKTTACASRTQTASGRALEIQDKPTGSVDLSTAIINVANQSIPTVVYIQVTQSKIIENPFLPFQNDPFFRKYFGIPKMPPRFRQEVTGVGSGMIIDPSGLILTNNHVAQGATKMIVMLANGSRHDAEVVGTDPKTDLAVIKINPSTKLTHVVFGNSDKVQVGEWVVAIGAPQAFEKSVTQGIISGMHRTGISEPTGYQDFLQTDASINPGNSGGPLLNLYGQVIGVNAAIATSSGGFEGIGFTIPSNIAVYVAKALITKGKVERGWLGVTVGDITPEIGKTRNIPPNTTGSLVQSVAKGGPAERAGLTPGDIVIAVNGKEVKTTNEFRNMIAQVQPGNVVVLTVLRSGKRQDIRVTTGSEKDAAASISASLQARLGGQFRSLTDAEIQKYRLKEGLGVIITSLERTGPLALAGFEVSDGILGINDQPVAGVDGLAVLTSTLKPGEKVTMIALDHRTGGTGKIAVTLR